jgi:FAD/FMN-containing dehydrogenase
METKFMDISQVGKGIDTKLRSRIKGQVLLADSPNYDDVRRVWNGMIDRHPAVIVRCAEVGDVAPAIAFAREIGLELSVRGGGHHIAGNCICNDGLMIDLSMLRTVQVDEKNRRAFADPGTTLGDFDAATQAYGLATPVGINSTTGIAGLTLGGGFGWLTRKYGMTIDNLLSAEVITADGKSRKASETENPDLFWAIRGGGGNFGIVTKFEFQLHPVGPEILAGLMVFPFDQAKQILTQYLQFIESAPEDLNVWILLRKAPPLPFLPESVHGKEIVAMPVFYAGDIAAGQRLIQPLRSLGDVYGEQIGPIPYVQWQQAFDPLLTAGARNYWKSHNFAELSDAAIDTAIRYAGNLPTPQCEIFFGMISGVANRIRPDTMAYRYRDAKIVLNVHGRWTDAAEDRKVIGWAREFFKASAPYASSGAYVNFMTEEESERVAAAYGPNYDRLVQIKTKYDPENIFHLNQNIKPKA